MSSTTTPNSQTNRLANLLKQELRPGEIILWQGKPTAKSALFYNTRGILKKIYLPITFGIIAAAYKQKILENPLIFIITLAFVIWVIFGYSLYKALRSYLVCKKTLYAITNERIIILDIINEERIISYSQREILSSTLIKKFHNDGTGDIAFSIGAKTFGFYFIKDSQEVAVLIEKEFKPKPVQLEIRKIQEHPWQSTQRIQ